MILRTLSNRSNTILSQTPKSSCAFVSEMETFIINNNNMVAVYTGVRRFWYSSRHGGSYIYIVFIITAAAIWYNAINCQLYESLDDKHDLFVLGFSAYNSVILLKWTYEPKNCIVSYIYIYIYIHRIYDSNVEKNIRLRTRDNTSVANDIIIMCL